MNRTQPLPSRLAKKEQQKLARQTLLILSATILMVVVFIFFVLPNIVRFAFNVIDSDPISQTEDTIPPQVPIIAAPPEATKSATIKISGYGEAKSEVVLVVDGNEADRKEVNDEGQFEFDLALTEGENSITAYAIDKAENESLTSKKYTVIFDQTVPSIEVIEPAANSTITLRKNQLTTIKGTTEPRAKVYVAGRLTTADGEGNFSNTFNLSEGENKISIVAEDQAGNSTETELIVNFQF